MRIGIDARLVYYSKAGIGQYIMHLTKALAQLPTPEDSFVLLQSRKDKTRIIDNHNFVRSNLWTPSHHRLEQMALRIEVNRTNLDLLHSPDFIPVFNRNHLSVITVHDLAFLLYPQFMTTESARYYGQIDHAVRSTNHIIAVSYATKQDLIKLLGVPEHKITVVYEGRNPLYQPMDRAIAAEYVKRKFGLEDDFIFFLSTIEPRKNVPTLIRSLKILRERYKRPEKLVLAGSQGWLFDEVNKTITELNLEHDVISLGRVDDVDVQYLYNSAQMLVYPSFYEGFGLPPLEAMTCGTPVIVSNIKVMPEIVGDAALLIDPHDEESLAIAIERILSDEEFRQEMVVKGFARAKKFSWEKAAQETLAVYHKVYNEQ